MRKVAKAASLEPITSNARRLFGVRAAPQGGRIVNAGVVAAIGVNAQGQREAPGMDADASKDGAFRSDFPRF